MEQKSIIRSIDKQILFISFLLFILLFQEAYRAYRKNGVPQIYIFIYYIFISWIIIFSSGFSQSPLLTKTIYIPDLRTFNESIHHIFAEYPAYKHVENRLESEKNFNRKVFSFPGDPLFYILFNQKPPYYLTTYEATPQQNQEKQIQFIQKENIQYVIYNTSTPGIQDGVPDYIRANETLKYILNNFSFLDTVNNFVLLKKSNTATDIFHNSHAQQFTNLFIKIDLANIPKEEGVYKFKFLLTHSKNIISKIPIEKFNKYLSVDQINTNNNFLIFYSQEKSMTPISLKITTTDNLQTFIYFTACDINTPCIIDLSRIPLFFKNRNIKKIEVLNKKNIKADVSVFTLKKDNYLW